TDDDTTDDDTTDDDTTDDDVADDDVPDPGDAGELTWSTSQYDLALQGDWTGTTLPLTLFIPDGDGPYPVVVFHHGFQLGPDHYLSYGEHLASWGIIAVLPQMPGGIWGGPNHRDLKEQLAGILDWIDDDVDEALSGRADPERIGLAGHSLGGKISLLLASEDDRPLAVFGVDPVDAAGGPLTSVGDEYPSVTPDRMDQIAVPIALLGEITNGTCTGFLCQPCAPEEENFHQYFEHATSPAIEIEVVGANHMSFLDDPDCGFTCSVCQAGTDDPASTHRLTRRSMVAFFLKEISGDERYGLYLTGAAMEADVDGGLLHWETKNGY
ncbi:hypothetical protein HQ560_01115, partial [bacterium]|nr:hypothetical protein [bacterium]